MRQSETNAMVAEWLKQKGYSEEEIRIILAKLAQHDHQTLSDAVFDSIGNGGKSIEQMLDDILRE